jgi:hypothetical protein
VIIIISEFKDSINYSFQFKDENEPNSSCTFQIKAHFNRYNNQLELYNIYCFNPNNNKYERVTNLFSEQYMVELINQKAANYLN